MAHSGALGGILIRLDDRVLEPEAVPVQLCGVERSYRHLASAHWVRNCLDFIHGAMGTTEGWWTPPPLPLKVGGDLDPKPVQGKEQTSWSAQWPKVRNHW